MLSPFSHLFGKAHSGFQAGDSPNYFIIGFVLCIVAFAFSDGIMLPCSFVLITQSLIWFVFLYLLTVIVVANVGMWLCLPTRWICLSAILWINSREVVFLASQTNNWLAYFISELMKGKFTVEKLWNGCLLLTRHYRLVAVFLLPDNLLIIDVVIYHELLKISWWNCPYLTLQQGTD